MDGEAAMTAFTELEMKQVTVSVVCVFPTIVVHTNHDISQRASKTERKDAMSALMPMRAVKNTNFLKTCRPDNDISARLQSQAAEQ